MHTRLFRLKSSTIAVSTPQNKALMVPSGETIKIDGTLPNTEVELLDVEWQGMVVKMFVRDIRDRGEELSTAEGAHASL